MAKNLVTLEEFKIYKNINSTEQDELINALIKRVSAFVKNFCKRTFIDYSTSNKVEYFDAVDVEDVFVSELPILSIASVEVSNDGGATYETPIIEYTDYFVDYELGHIVSSTCFTQFGTSTVSSGKSKRSLKLTYKGGYVILPDDLKQATLDLVEYYRANEYTPRQNFGQFQTENLGFRAGSSSNLPSHILRVFSLYREL